MKCRSSSLRSKDKAQGSERGEMSQSCAQSSHSNISDLTTAMKEIAVSW